MRRGAKPAKAKVEAKPPSARKSRKNEGSTVSDLEKRLAEALQREAEASKREAAALGKLQKRDRELAEALEQQTAAGEILRVIRSSPSDLQPVAQAIADTARRLCDCTYAGVFRFDGELIHWVAARGASREQEEELRSTWPRPPDHRFMVGRTILARDTCHVYDAAADVNYTAIPLPAAREAAAIRTFLGVPMLRDGEPIGVIALIRTEVRPFSEREVALVQTFAEQAVIAIENVRLFTELQEKNSALTAAHSQVTESLERQTATSEILRVIGSSPTDVQPVFETIARNAVSVCAALACAVFEVDGDMLRVAATHGVPAERVERFRQEFPIPLSADHDAAQPCRRAASFIWPTSSTTRTPLSRMSRTHGWGGTGLG